MIVPGQHVRIVVATKPVDFRRGHDGLAATVERELGLDPYSGLIVIFRAKRADRAKILMWDGTGLVMIYKRLETGKFVWPQVHDGVMRFVEGAIRGFVRRHGLASDDGAARGKTCCGGVTHPTA